jgi:uncharacterized membrane protein
MFTNKTHKPTTAIMLGILLTFLIVSIVLAAELITEKSEEPINEVTLFHGTSAEFSISISAEGAIDCNVLPDDPATAKVHTTFHIDADGMITSQDFSEPMGFYSSGEPDPDPSTGNCGTTWIGAPQPYNVNATISAHEDATSGEYIIVLSKAAGTVQVRNPPSVTRAKLEDKIATHIIVHLTQAEYGLLLEPQQDALYGDPAEVVEYILTLTNIGNITDAFGITFEGNDWDVHLAEDEFTLEAGESATVNVQVTIPPETMAGEFDSVTITATSAGDEDLSASSTLTTTTNAIYGLMLEPEEGALYGDPDETVFYIMTLTNTGNILDTFDLVAGMSDWDVHLPVNGFELGAGGSVDVSVQITVAADALAGEFDSVTITATSIGDENVSANSTLTTTSNAVYGLMLEPEEGALYGDPDETVFYIMTLTNTGNILDTFDLVAGESDWDVHLPENGFELGAGESVDVSMQITVAADALAGEFDSVTITATSIGDEHVSASSTLTTTSNAVYGLMLEPEQNTLSGGPGEIVSYILSLTNIGNLSDTYALEAVGNGWDINLSEGSVGLGAGESAEIRVDISIPPNVLAGEFDLVSVTATSVGNNSFSATSTLTTRANPIYAVQLTAGEVSLHAKPGDTVTFSLNLTNSGNIFDTYEITFSGNNWSVQLAQTSLDLLQGTSAMVMVRVNIPPDAEDGDSETITITATSLNDDGISSSVSLTTTTFVEPETGSAGFQLFLPVINNK